MVEPCGHFVVASLILTAIVISVKVIAMGCMSAQMEYEMKEGQPLAAAPTKQRMDRGDLDGGDEDPEDAWWKKT